MTSLSGSGISHQTISSSFLGALTMASAPAACWLPTCPPYSLAMLALTGLAGWLLLLILPVDLTVFEAILLFAISLTSGLFFHIQVRQRRFTEVDNTVRYRLKDEDDYVITPPKRRAKRRSKSR